MRINFRQGLISFQKESGSPRFLQESGSNSAFISHVVTPTSTTITFAHGTSDYLVTFDTTIDLAWGPMVTGVDNYLYWDIDLLTSNVTRGITTLIPVTALHAPVSPAHDQHWFDLSTTTMKVWDASQNKWRPRVRLFAGRVVQGNTDAIIMQAEGSQVGLNTPANPGYIVLDTLLQPLRKSNGEFLTDDDHSRVRSTVGTGGVLVQPVNRVINVRAGESIPRMSLVYFSAADVVRLASSNPALIPNRVPVGVVIDDIANGDMGTLVVGGELTYDGWNWAGREGQALYCDSYGQFTTTRPSGLMAYRVGFIKNAHSVLFNVDAETFPQVYTADTNSLIIAGITPIAVSDTVNGLGERVVTISAPDVTGDSRGFMTPALYGMLDNHEVRLTTAEADIVTLQTSKSNVGHLHAIADVTNLQSNLDTLFADVALKADKVNPATAGHFASLTADGNLADSGYGASSFSLVGHLHTIPDVSGLQTALNNKSDVGHSHTIPDVTGLQLALDGKAAVIHVHAIGDTTGLQTALDGKAALVHAHAIADVTGLQIELDNRAFVSHTHTISNITGLQTALDGKVAKAGDVMTGFLTLSADPIQNMHAATKQYVDSHAVTFGSIDQHTDVDTVTVAPTIGQALKWDGANWVPADVGTLPSVYVLL